MHHSPSLLSVGNLCGEWNYFFNKSVFILWIGLFLSMGLYPITPSRCSLFPTRYSKHVTIRESLLAMIHYELITITTTYATNSSVHALFCLILFPSVHIIAIISLLKRQYLNLKHQFRIRHDPPRWKSPGSIRIIGCTMDLGQFTQTHTNDTFIPSFNNLS